eukprot:TRINITY_DN5547_c0_g1_i2.p1 TRINITY_DN5547_c0_g1~~TRINITY_DN5547_c0_g1_i2.p1  ORF type:complete len:302 (-),score=29.79 TRINITY_DN5547_c0_g1_i2:386-1291(-)
MKEHIVELNVGGSLVTTCRSTLCLMEGSKLAHMFGSDDRFKSLLRDGQDRVFLDYDPDVFIPIINYLRRRKICGRTEPPSIPQSKRSSFDELVVELGLQAYLWVPANIFHVTLKSQMITLTHDMRCSLGQGSALGSTKFSDAVVYARFRIEHTENSSAEVPVYLGVVMHQEIAYLGPVSNQPTRHQNNASYICNPSGVVVALFGKTPFTINHFLPGLFLSQPVLDVQPKMYKSGTEVNMTLCCKEQNYVSAVDQSDEHRDKQTIDLPPGAFWRFFVMSKDAKAKITFVDCTRLTELAAQSF